MATPRSTARLALTPARTIGVGLSDFESAFEGVVFEYSRLGDGRDRWIAFNLDAVVEVIGPSGALEQALISLPVNPDRARLSLAMFSIFLDAALPGWGDDGINWLIENIGSTVDRKVTTEVSGRDAHVLVSLETFSELGVIVLSVEAR